jgi:aryl-alcohol dehydrogenase-like predicted oxidoreductase
VLAAKTLSMEYTTLGSTGMSVSRICLGTMTFDSDWKLDSDDA